MTRSATILKARFEGDIKDLRGAYFNCAGNYRANIYDVLMKLISRYATREYAHSVDIRHVVTKMESLTLAVSVDPI